MTEKVFTAPPEELIQRWVAESENRPTMQSAWNYVAFKAAEWGFNSALEIDPNSIKSKALRALSKIEDLSIVPVWIGKDALNNIRTAIESLPNY